MRGPGSTGTLHVATAAALLLGFAVGLAGAATGKAWLLAVASAAEPLGRLFLAAIRMVVIPLVVLVVFASVARLGSPRRLGRLGGTAIAWYWLTLLPAIAIGMAVTRVGLQFAAAPAIGEVSAAVLPELPGLVDFLVSLVPANPFAAAANGEILSLIVFTVLVAAAAGTLEARRRDRLVALADDAGAALIRLAWWILYAAPVGVFGLTAPLAAAVGWDLVQSLAVFILCVLAGLVLFLALVMLPLVYLVARIRPGRLFAGTLGALSVAVSTTSTVAAIPVTLEETTAKLGVSPATADLLVPLGAAMHRPGSALFQGAAIVFLAHLYDVPIPAAALAAAFLATFLVSLTVAPVPSSGVVTLAPALDAVGVPAGGLALLLGVDRIPDMLRSGTNLLAQVSAAAAIDRLSGTASRQAR